MRGESVLAVAVLRFSLILFFVMIQNAEDCYEETDDDKCCHNYVIFIVINFVFDYGTKVIWYVGKNMAHVN